MSLLLLVVILLLIFGGGGLGYHRWGYGGDSGIGGVLLIVLLIVLCSDTADFAIALLSEPHIVI